MRNPLSKELRNVVLSFFVGAGGAGVGSVYLTDNGLTQGVTQQEIKQAKQAKAPTEVELLNALLDEKEGNRLTSYRDGGGVWTICRGVTRLSSGKPVRRGMTMTASECDELNSAESKKALDWVHKNVKISLNPVQAAAIASFCPYNIGETKCKKSTFFKLLQKGEWKAACHQIPRWVYDGGKNCSIRSNGCYGQVSRREDEEYMCLLSLGEKK